MNSGSEHEVVSGQKSAQQYIDETPLWADGTALQTTPMTGMRWRIWTLAAAGKFLRGTRCLHDRRRHAAHRRRVQNNSGPHGVVGAASLFGILVGAVSLGSLPDHFGRKRMFVIEMFIFMIFLCLIVVSPSYFWLVFFLFGIGVALGCDYPTAHLIISETIPTSMRGRLVLGAFGFQALGALTGTGVGYVIPNNIPQIGAWRWIYASAIIGLLVTLARFSITESAPWLFARGRVDGAAAAGRAFLPSGCNSSCRRGTSRRKSWASPQLREQRQSACYDLRLGALVPSGPRDVWHRDLHTHDSRASVGHRTKYVRSLADLINNEYPGRERRGAHRHPANRGYCFRDPAFRSSWQDQAADLGLRWLRRRLVFGLAFRFLYRRPRTGRPVSRRGRQTHGAWPTNPSLYSRSCVEWFGFLTEKL